MRLRGITSAQPAVQKLKSPPVTRHEGPRQILTRDAAQHPRKRLPTPTKQSPTHPEIFHHGHGLHKYTTGPTAVPAELRKLLGVDRYQVKVYTKSPNLSNTLEPLHDVFKEPSVHLTDPGIRGTLQYLYSRSQAAFDTSASSKDTFVQLIKDYVRASSLSRRARLKKTSRNAWNVSCQLRTHGLQDQFSYKPVITLSFPVLGIQESSGLFARPPGMSPGAKLEARLKFDWDLSSLDPLKHVSMAEENSHKQLKESGFHSVVRDMNISVFRGLKSDKGLTAASLVDKGNVLLERAFRSSELSKYLQLAVSEVALRTPEGHRVVANKVYDIESQLGSALSNTGHMKVSSGTSHIPRHELSSAASERCGAKSVTASLSSLDSTLDVQSLETLSDVPQAFDDALSTTSNTGLASLIEITPYLAARFKLDHKTSLTISPLTPYCPLLGGQGLSEGGGSAEFGLAVSIKGPLHDPSLGLRVRINNLGSLHIRVLGKEAGAEVTLSGIELSAQWISTTAVISDQHVVPSAHLMEELRHLTDSATSVLEAITRSMVFQSPQAGLAMLGEAILRKVHFLTPAFQLEKVVLRTKANDEPVMHTYVESSAKDTAPPGTRKQTDELPVSRRSSLETTDAFDDKSKQVEAEPPDYVTNSESRSPPDEAPKIVNEVLRSRKLTNTTGFDLAVLDAHCTPAGLEVLRSLSLLKLETLRTGSLHAIEDLCREISTHRSFSTTKSISFHKSLASDHVPHMTAKLTNEVSLFFVPTPEKPPGYPRIQLPWLSASEVTIHGFETGSGRTVSFKLRLHGKFAPRNDPNDGPVAQMLQQMTASISTTLISSSEGKAFVSCESFAQHIAQDLIDRIAIIRPYIHLRHLEVTAGVWHAGSSSKTKWDTKVSVSRTVPEDMLRDEACDGQRDEQKMTLGNEDLSATPDPEPRPGADHRPSDTSAESILAPETAEHLNEEVNRDGPTTDENGSAEARERPQIQDVPNVMQRGVVIALGSNIGNRVGEIEKACRAIDEDPDMHIVDTSPLYETDPMYVEDQDRFLNGVCEIETTLEPMQLLDRLQEIERRLGRSKTIDKGPRNIDLDILLFRDMVIRNERLTVPHALMLEREFVLRPLCKLKDISSRRLPQRACSPASALGNLMTREGFVPQEMHTFTVLAPGLSLSATDRRRKTHVMSILNTTPDSFSDGGLNPALDTTALKEVAVAHIRAGATIIDVGGQSSRPNALDVTAEEEIERVLPAIAAIRQLPEAKGIAISVDTYRAEVAEAAVAAGAHIVNDISAGALDPRMLETVARLGCTYVMMHMRGTPHTMTSEENCTYPALGGDIRRELGQRIELAIAAGIRRWRIIVDPGLGFAKNEQQNLGLLRMGSDVWKAPYFPSLFGPSRKRFIGNVTGIQIPAERTWGTAAAVTAAIQSHADIVRVHDVKEMAQVAKMADAIYRSRSLTLASSKGKSTARASVDTQERDA